MKNKTALRQSIVSVKFLAIAIAAMVVLAFKYPSGYTIIPLQSLPFTFSWMRWLSAASGAKHHKILRSWTKSSKIRVAGPFSAIF